MIPDKRFLLVVLVAVLSRVWLYPFFPNPGWDESAYLLMGRYFSGDRIYFEDIRPPLYSLTLSVMHLFHAGAYVKAVPIAFSILLVILTYFLALNILSDSGTALLSSFFVAANPLLIEWSSRYMTETPAMCLSITALIMAHYYVKKNNALYFHGAIFFSALTFLMKYPMGIMVPLVYLIHFRYGCGKSISSFLKNKNTYMGGVVFAATAAPWFIYSEINFSGAFAGISQAFNLPLQDINNPFTYVIESPKTFSFELVPVLWILALLLARGRKVVESANEEFLYFIAIPLIAYLLFFQSFAHKESRYLISIVPFLGVFVSHAIVKTYGGFKFSAQMVFFCSILVLSFYSAVVYVNLLEKYSCGVESFIEAGKRIRQQPEKGKILSNQWPFSSYYSRRTSRSFPPDEKDLEEIIAYENVSFLFISTDIGAWPEYARTVNPSNRKYLTDSGYFNDSCRVIQLYKVNRSILSESG